MVAVAKISARQVELYLKTLVRVRTSMRHGDGQLDSPTCRLQGFQRLTGDHTQFPPPDLAFDAIVSCASSTLMARAHRLSSPSASEATPPLLLLRRRCR